MLVFVPLPLRFVLIYIFVPRNFAPDRMTIFLGAIYFYSELICIMCLFWYGKIRWICFIFSLCFTIIISFVSSVLSSQIAGPIVCTCLKLEVQLWVFFYVVGCLMLMMQVVDTFADSRQNDVQNLAEELEDEIEHDRHLPDRFKPKNWAWRCESWAPNLQK